MEVGAQGSTKREGTLVWLPWMPMEGAWKPPEVAGSEHIPDPQLSCRAVVLGDLQVEPGSQQARQVQARARANGPTRIRIIVIIFITDLIPYTPRQPGLALCRLNVLANPSESGLSSPRTRDSRRGPCPRAAAQPCTAGPPTPRGRGPQLGPYSGKAEHGSLSSTLGQRFGHVPTADGRCHETKGLRVYAKQMCLADQLVNTTVLISSSRHRHRHAGADNSQTLGYRTHHICLAGAPVRCLPFQKGVLPSAHTHSHVLRGTRLTVLAHST